MGSIRLAKEELHQLPPVCYVCGEYADTTQSSDPRESAIITFFGTSFPWMFTGMCIALVVSILERNFWWKQFRLPTCRAHRHHWRIRMWIALLLAVSTWVGAIFAWAAPVNLPVDMRVLVLGTLGWILIATLIAIWLDTTGPRLESVWPESVILMDVHDEFVAAVEDLREDRESAEKP